MGKRDDAPEHVYDMIIVGGGPGGYTAALYAARAGLDVILLERLAAGGQMALTERVDNYPGFDEGINGYELGERMRRGAERFGAKTRMAEAKALTLAGVVKRVETSDGTLLVRTIVLATVAVPRELGLARERELTGKGVHYCAACDGMFYRGKTVAVVGGGNSAAEDALLLSRICRRVILIHRRDILRAEKIYQAPLMEAENVEFCWDSVVTELLGETGCGPSDYGMSGPERSARRPATVCLSVSAGSPPLGWQTDSSNWTRRAISRRTNPPGRPSPVYLRWATCGSRLCVRL